MGVADPATGSILKFGKTSWHVLDVRSDRALLIAEHIIEKRPYNDNYVDVSWESCTLRRYLNGDFFGAFSKPEQDSILEVRNINADNPWFGTQGGGSTSDRVFLLSIEEAVKYFGDSGQLQNKNPSSKYWIDDRYNGERAAKYGNAPRWWWLRSPGIGGHTAGVGDDGDVNLHGRRIDFRAGGVRPALWVNFTK